MLEKYLSQNGRRKVFASSENQYGKKVFNRTVDGFILLCLFSRNQLNLYGLKGQ